MRKKVWWRRRAEAIRAQIILSLISRVCTAALAQACRACRGAQLFGKLPPNVFMLLGIDEPDLLGELFEDSN